MDARSAEPSVKPETIAVSGSPTLIYTLCHEACSKLDVLTIDSADPGDNKRPRTAFAKLDPVLPQSHPLNLPVTGVPLVWFLLLVMAP